LKINLNNEGNNSPRVEVVPLIDVIFCILTVFLLSGLQVARQQAINVDIPKAKTAESQARQMLIISLDAEGRVFSEQTQLLTPFAVSEAAKNYRLTIPNGSIVLYASKQVRYERVMEILDLLRQVAGENVALATANPAETASPAPTVPNFSPSPNAPIPSGAVPTVSPTNSAVPSVVVPTAIPTSSTAPSFAAPTTSPSVLPLPNANSSPSKAPSR
jgi:biopolymer transport protein ExbD